VLPLAGAIGDPGWPQSATSRDIHRATILDIEPDVSYDAYQERIAAFEMSDVVILD
jgi:hypothetical protein